MHVSWLAGVCASVWLVATAAAAAPPAVYEVEFEATWSAASHPTDFPPDPHFSPLIGATHDDTAVFWESGGLATPGIERMAERGRTPRLEAEIETAIAGGIASSVILGSGFDSPGQTSVDLTISEDHPRVTLVAMLAPSPDWFVGVNGLLLLEDGAWLEEVVIDLDPYDAGTDDGVTFTSPDSDSVPQQPIAKISGFPFENTPPVGQYRFRLVPACRDGIDNDGDGLLDFDGAGVGAADPQCLGNPERDRENARACGIGFEASFAVLAFAFVRARRRR